MSKKRKGQSGGATPNPVAQQQPKPQPAPVRSQPVIPSKAVESTLTEQSFQLIRFDKRLKWFMGICVGLFLLLTLSKIHSISLALWNQLMPDGSNPKRGLISGEPRRIRMDDYAVGTPWILSQANKGFPTENLTIGGEKAPILVTPTKHFSVLFKPDQWGFFIFDVERGYAWMHNFRVMFALIGATLMLLLLTRNNFWLSVFGSVWLFLSSGTQYWMYIPTPMIAAMSLIFVASVYLIYSDNPKAILLSAVALAWLLMDYALILYPPYELPLGYVLVCLLLGYILNNIELNRMAKRWPIKAGAAVLALGLTGIAFWSFYSDVKPTLDAIMNTVYPGKRSELGGTGFIANWFSEYFSWMVSDTKLPSNWLNSCEQSHYITFAPIIIPCALISFSLYRKIDWVVLLLITFVIFGYIWIEVGFPEWLAKLTLWSMSPTRRTQIPFGIGNVLLTLAYLYYLSTLPIKANTLYTAIGVAGVLAYMIYAANVNVDDSAGFFKMGQLIMPTVFFAAVGSLLLFSWDVPYRNLLFGSAITLFLLPNLRINPVSKGMAPITDHLLYKTVQSIHAQEPNAKWVVFGGQYVAYMVTATGVDVLSGVKYIPPRSVLKVLDPTMKRDSAYNRFAHTIYTSYVDGRDSVIIQNTFEDGYTVAMDPCSPKLKQLNVKYVVFDHTLHPAENRCMKLVSTLGSLTIYRIND
ncbi:DUF7657 domain-containing protein [Spirosoma gilvum]